MIYNTIKDIIDEVLGEPRNSGYQLDYNCPKCAELNNGVIDNKYNLAINIEYQKYHCWKCELSGSYIQKLIDRYAKDKIRWDYNSHLLNKELIKKEYKNVVLPNEFMFLDKKDETHKPFFDYLYGRGIEDYHIKKYSIGLAKSGLYRNRVIIPSYDVYNKLNMFVARDITQKNTLRYMTPKDVLRDIIIFENIIDFNTKIYVVEGVFDAMVIPNATPILGKNMSDALFKKIVLYKTPVGILLDKDAIKESEKYLIKLYNSNIDVELIEIDKKDTSKINEEEGRLGIKKILKL